MPRNGHAPVLDPLALGDDTAALVAAIQREKYMLPKEASWAATHLRVADAVFPNDPDRGEQLLDELTARRACPAGRVLAGAGSGREVTWWNCFVGPLLQDSMRTDPARPGLGIMDALGSVAYSMQAGGGVGTDFSPLRPAGSLVRGVGAPASGVLPFMAMQDAMCRTVMAAGYRRGAMMATLRCDHPDLFPFIRVKRDPTQLRMFNLSVLVTDELMRAVREDLPFALGHWEPPIGGAVAIQTRRDPYDDDRERPWYVYEVVSARALWDELMETTYRYAEPGVIFIDVANRMNNLYYCEHLQCSNPCGEQILAPDDNCNLSHVNLSRCLLGEPFADGCALDEAVVERVARLLVRMGDNVIDLSPVPTPAQRAAAQAKRRIGLGVTGLANALMFQRLRYGAPAAIAATELALRTVRDAAYRESIELAKERGPFPLFDRDRYLAGEFIRTLPEDVRDGIAEHGVRNALLLTVAPTGTVSIAQADNSSAGLEPVFLARYKRRKLEPDGSYSEHVIEDLGFRAYANVKFGGDLDAALAAPLPDYMVTTADLTPEDHLLTQAAVQRYVDNSVSKTINVPTDTPLAAFIDIYRRAYELGCKGCTTYREVPDSGRGAVLTAVDPVSSIVDSTAPIPALRERPETLTGSTRRLRWSGLPYPMFLTVNDEVTADGRRVPFEVFVNSKAVDYAHWVSALTRMISAVMRKGGDLSFIPEELKQVWSARGGQWIDGSYVPSEVALIGAALERHFREVGYLPPEQPTPPKDVTLNASGAGYAELGRQCPECKQPTVVNQEGCDRCLSCPWSNCG